MITSNKQIRFKMYKILLCRQNEEGTGQPSSGDSDLPLIRPGSPSSAEKDILRYYYYIHNGIDTGNCVTLIQSNVIFWKYFLKPLTVPKTYFLFLSVASLLFFPQLSLFSFASRLFGSELYFVAQCSFGFRGNVACLLYPGVE